MAVDWDTPAVDIPDIGQDSWEADFGGIGDIGVDSVGRTATVVAGSEFGDKCLGRDFAEHSPDSGWRWN